MDTLFSYKCPKCGSPLAWLNNQTPGHYRCDSNHCFDIAKEGYVNLHLVEKKKSKSPGDDAQMMKSRRSFLNAGYYHILANAIFKTLLRAAPDARHIIDMGCGEGYYLEQLLTQHSANQDPTIKAAGIDLSKQGIRLAAKRNTGAQLSVASVFDIPFFDNQFDAALSVFSPLCPKETLRVLKPGAILIMVGPGPAHLRQLAAMIYKDPRAHQGNFDVLQGHDDFAFESSETVTTHLNVKGDALPDLLRMTPYYWQATPEQQQQLSQRPNLIIECQFEIQTYRIQLEPNV